MRIGGTPECPLVGLWRYDRNTLAEFVRRCQLQFERREHNGRVFHAHRGYFGRADPAGK